eukprot:3067570-Karenia_brevis.AAC.1
MPAHKRAFMQAIQQASSLEDLRGEFKRSKKDSVVKARGMVNSLEAKLADESTDFNPLEYMEASL